MVVTILFYGAAILDKTGSSKIIARLVANQMLLSHFMRQKMFNNRLWKKYTLTFSNYINSHFC